MQACTATLLDVPEAGHTAQWYFGWECLVRLDEELNFFCLMKLELKAEMVVLFELDLMERVYHPGHARNHYAYRKAAGHHVRYPRHLLRYPQRPRYPRLPRRRPVQRLPCAMHRHLTLRRRWKDFGPEGS
jgi:hypothetical protein